jgi:general secretion pathway protein C
VLTIVRKYLWILHLIAIGICTYFFAQTVANYISTLLYVGGPVVAKASAAQRPLPSSRPPSLDSFEIVVERDIFNSASLPEGGEEVVAEEEGEEEPQLKTAVKTSLSIKLLGTLVVGAGEDRRSSATIEGGRPNSKATVYFIGGDETFGPEVKVVRIMPRRVEFINGKRLEFVEMGDSSGLSIFRPPSEVHEGGGKGGAGEAASPPSSEAGGGIVKEAEGKVVIDQQEVENALTNLDKLYTEIRIVPNFKNGKAAGMKVLSIKPGSIFSKLGLKRGDVLEQINGMELDIKSGMQLFGQLKDAKNLTIDLQRQGQNKSIEYEIR